jgi:hypothetical protein
MSLTYDERTELWILRHRLRLEALRVRMSVALDPFRPIDVVLAEVQRAHESRLS